MSATSAEERLAAAAEACRLKLEVDSYSQIVGRLGPYGRPEQAFHLLSKVTTLPESCAEIVRLCGSVRPEVDENIAEQTLLLLAARHAVAQVPQLPVSDVVKGLFADEFQFFANPPAIWAPRFQGGDVRFREMARVATLRRFPIGQFQWEVAGFPRSWVVKARPPWKVLAHVIGPLGGFGPLFELHVNDRRKNRLVLLEKEGCASFYRAARSVEKQPAVKGLMLSSWLFCKSTGQVTPRLAWLRRTPEAAGALVVDLGPASPDSGFLTGSEERRRLYEQNLYRPRESCVLWPRKALLAWADQHPEFDV